MVDSDWECQHIYDSPVLDCLPVQVVVSLYQITCSLL